MKRVALALSWLLVAACDLSVPTTSIDFDAGLSLPDGGGTECGQNPCLNDGACMLTNDGFQCTCQPGYEGQLCDIDVNDCDPNPCLNEGVCTDGVASYTCECAAGFEGVDCSTNIDECADAPCLNAGVCTDMVNSYQCDCAAGYSGSQCEVDVDDCSPNPCENDGACVDGVNAFTCVCKQGHTGVTCSDTIQQCASDTCQNGGTCEDRVDGFTCICLPGYNGATCETDIDDCATMPCENGAICTDKVNGYSCECPDGTTGVNCENLPDPCAPNPCLNEGVCTSAGADAFVCSCVPGYNGASCENNIDDCEPNPCSNNGTCTDGINGFTCDCPSPFEGTTCNNEPAFCPDPDPCEHGTCKEGVSGFTCECEAGYNGALCQVDVDDCAPNNPCQHGTCTDGVNTFTCACDAGYEGTICDSNIDDCKSAPCQNAGTCVDEVDAFTCSCTPGWGGADCSANIDDCTPSSCLNGGTCTDGLNAYTCACARFFSGDHCEISECSMLGVCSGHGSCDGQGGCTCSSGWQGDDCQTNIDECATANPCAHGTCQDQVGSYQCTCDPGYEGMQCDVDTNDCASDPCLHGMCTDAVNGFSCLCDTGYEGTTCEVNTDDCMPQPCQNGGGCTDLVGGFMCSCTQGWGGSDCSANIDDCTPGACINGGTCQDGLNAYTCVCPRFFSGQHCEISECSMVGVCSGHGVCDGQGGCACSSGWQGNDCETDIVECPSANPNPCLHGGQCTNTPGSFSCACATGYVGTTCSACATGYQDNDHDDVCCLPGYKGLTCSECEAGYQDINGICQKTCASVQPQLQCGDHGMCSDNGGDPLCVCDNGYFGPACDSLQGSCSLSACGANGTCESTSVSTYKCNCNTAYSGRNCETRDECVLAQSQGMTPCSGNGTCIDGNNAYTCMCQSGWLGTECNNPDDCYAASQPGLDACNNHGTCTDGNNTYTCSCAAGWLGAHCDNADDCVGNMCINGGQCVDGSGSYTCDCSATNYEGQYCQTKIDRCQGTPCKNGGVCTDIGATYSCSCTKTGFTGSTCEDDLDECTATPTVCNLGVCTNIAAGGGYSCQCPDGMLDLDGDGTNCAAVASLAAGALNTCAITTAGSLHCWGDNSLAQLASSNGNPAGSVARTPKRIGTGTGWQKVSVGGRFATTGMTPTAAIGHVCGIRSGHLFCWGDNGLLQLGQPGSAYSSTLVELRSDLTWTDVTAGDAHTCALAGSALYCWGNSADLQAGTPVNPPLVDAPKQIAGSWVSVSAGAEHTCAINSAKELRCWGKNDNGQLGATTQPVALPVGADGDWTAVKAGPTHTCAVAGTKNYCWGTVTAGTLGDGSTTNSPTPVEVMDASTLNGLGTGVDFSCGTVKDADPATTFQLYCWGGNANGLLLTADAGANVPQVVTRAPSTWSAYAIGKTHMCGVDNGFLYCWGSNADGALGRGAPDLSPTHAAATVSSALVSHSSSSNCMPNPCQNGGVCTDTGSGFTCNCTGTGYSGTTCASEADACATAGLCGQGLCANLSGNPGYTCKCQDGKIDVDGSGKVCANVATIAAGYNQSCVLTDVGSLHCWGSNRYGQLGLGMVGTTPYYPNESSQTVRTPLRIKTIPGNSDVKDWTRLTVGENHVCATRPAASGTAEELYCWGDNTTGQVGLPIDPLPPSGTPPSHPEPSPRLLDNTQTWLALVAGNGHTCAINTSNQLYCWGNNKFGQIGTGAASSTVTVPFSLSTPVALPGSETGWIAVAGGNAHTCAVAQSSTTYCWGAGASGQIGGGTSTSSIPALTKVAAPADPQGYTAVWADFSQSCALVGTQAYCWGKGNLGAVGAGSFTPTANPSPLAVLGGQVFARLTLGSDLSCGLVALTGTSPQAYEAYCWGSNVRGMQLTGGGNVNMPTLVPSRTWRIFELGVTHACAVDAADGLLYCWGDNGNESGVGIGKLGTEPASIVMNFPPEAVKAASVTYTSP